MANYDFQRFCENRKRSANEALDRVCCDIIKNYNCDVNAYFEHVAMPVLENTKSVDSKELLEEFEHQSNLLLEKGGWWDFLSGKTGRSAHQSPAVMPSGQEFAQSIGQTPRIDPNVAAMAQSDQGAQYNRMPSGQEFTQGLPPEMQQAQAQAQAERQQAAAADPNVAAMMQGDQGAPDPVQAMQQAAGPQYNAQQQKALDHLNKNVLPHVKATFTKRLKSALHQATKELKDKGLNLYNKGNKMAGNAIWAATDALNNYTNQNIQQNIADYAPKVNFGPDTKFRQAVGGMQAHQAVDAIDPAKNPITSSAPQQEPIQEPIQAPSDYQQAVPATDDTYGVQAMNDTPENRALAAAANPRKFRHSPQRKLMHRDHYDLNQFSQSINENAQWLDSVKKK